MLGTQVGVSNGNPVHGLEAARRVAPARVILVDHIRDSDWAEAFLTSLGQPG